jgi:energy-coupling factor transporter transmembrane protein EcfT
MKESTFIFYLSETSLFFKINFITKIILLILVSLVVLLSHSYIINFMLVFIFGILIFMTGFFKYNKIVFKSLFIAIVIFSLFWILLSRIPGNNIYFYLPWGTYFSDSTFQFMLLGISKWLAIVISGMLFMITTNERQMINFMLSSRTSPKIIIFFSILFNTVGFSIREISTINDSLDSRGFKGKGLIGTMRRVLFVGIVEIISNLKKVETLNQSYVLRQEMIFRGIKNAQNRPR